MRKVLWALLMVVVAQLFVGAAAPANDLDHAQPSASVTIRVYQNGLVAREDRLSAVSEAAGILKTAGVEVRWRACDDGSIQPDADPCAESLRGHELAIRFLRQPLRPNHLGQVPLGSSLIDAESGVGSFATIYVDRVESLAHDAGARVDVLLGRAIAHEIGHLLLGTAQHTRTGLMRSVWSSHAMRRDAAGEWLFTSSEARSIRDALLLNTR